jgi:uncharacterized repeat protein (TIGR01451 family)
VSTATDTPTAAPAPALAMQKVLLGRAAPGATVVYSITVANTGGAPTVDPISVVDDLPAGLTFQQVNAAGWSCTPMPPTVGCTYGAALAPGQLTPPIRITVVVTAQAGTSLHNVAVANSGVMTAAADNEARVLGPAAPAPLLSPFGAVAALAALLAVAARAQRRRHPAP